MSRSRKHICTFIDLGFLNEGEGVEVILSIFNW